MGEIDKLRKLLKSKISKGLEKSKTFQSKLKRQAEKNIDIDESDIPIHEKHVKPSNESEIGFEKPKVFQKEEHIKQLKKNKRKIT